MHVSTTQQLGRGQVVYLIPHDWCPLAMVWRMTLANDLAVRRALESAGIEFIDENGGGLGVRFKKRQMDSDVRLRKGQQKKR
jgi:hypothetical protein